MPFAPDDLIVRRPHYALRGREVVFLISRRAAATLAPEEIPLFQAIGDSLDGARTAAELERAHPGASSILARWWRAELIERLPPLSEPPPGHLVVIEPHMDDAALSVGGRLLNRRGQRVTIASLTRESNVTCYWHLDRRFFDRERVTALRVAESELAARSLGARFAALDLPDAPLRFRPEADWAAPGRFDALHDALAPFLGFPPTEDQIAPAARALRALLVSLEPTELWCPMGLGSHVDHRLTRAACLRAIAALPPTLRQIPILFYEDLPYAEYFPDQADAVLDAFAAAGTALAPEVEPIDAVFDEKVRLVAMYASQFKGAAMEPGLRAHAERAVRSVDGAERVGGLASDSALGERAFRLERLGGIPPETALAPDAGELVAARPVVAGWAAEADRWRQVHAIAPSAFGRWETCVQILTDAFPRAELTVWVDALHAWEIVDTPARVRIRVVTDWPGALEAARGQVTPDSLVIAARFPPWPFEQRWREQILRGAFPEGLRYPELERLLAAAPSLTCRHLGDVCALLAEAAG